mgnify:CR=1 FL=1
MQEYIIGLRHPESIQIPPKHNAVSGHHAKITVHDNGEWMLEDIGSTNGTYVVQPDGSLRQVSRMRITPATTIQLGPPTVNGYRFTASYVTKDLDPAWQALQADLFYIKSCEEKFKSRARTFGWLQKTSSIIALGLTFLVDMVVTMDSQTMMFVRMGFMAVAPAIVGVAMDLSLKGREELLRKRKGLVCPNPACQRPLGEREIEYGACPFCKSYRKY